MKKKTESLKPIRSDDGTWLNISGFRGPALYFIKNGYYCPHPYNTPAWYDYWAEQRKRCIEGYSIGKDKITGAHYFYLNFCPIKLAEKGKSNIAKKLHTFPHFWDGDYNYFWCREIAKYGLEKDGERKSDGELKKRFDDLGLHVKIKKENLRGGFNFIVGKARRRGYSYKSASIAVRNYFTIPKSITILNAYERKYLSPNGIFSIAKDYINHINEHTGWTTPSDVVNKADHIKASYISYVNDVKTEKGLKSEIIATTCNDNADANRGKDAEDIFIEEAGTFGTPGLLKDLYAASQDCVQAGSYKTGMITIFGTSGDMEGGTMDYADMHTKPSAFGLLPCYNIWDEGFADTECGFFHPINWNMEGFYDNQGNSDLEGGKKYELDSREKLKENGASSRELQQKMQQKSLGPVEAFGNISVNNFPIVELKRQLAIVKAKKLQEVKGTPVEFYVQTEGKKRSVKAKAILNGKANPITELKPLVDKRGCPVIYEHPIEDAPRGLYKIGYDPVRQDEGSSLAAIIVYKGFCKGNMHHHIIVAEYIGRLESTDDLDRIAGYFADFYNTTIMYENEVPGVKNFFYRTKRLDLLAVQPDSVISKNIKFSRVSRIYGCHMTSQLKDAGERYVKDWLLTELNFDENGSIVRPIDYIYSIRLLEELISYNRKGNFDLISALFMCMFQVQEEEIGKEYSNKKNIEASKSIDDFYKNMYV